MGQTRSRTRKRRTVHGREEWSEPLIEPELTSRALASLSEAQRIAVILVHGFGWTMREVGELTGTRVTTVQTHLDRGLRKLQRPWRSKNMLDLSERIRDYVDTASPRVTLDDIERHLTQRSDRQPPAVAHGRRRRSVLIGAIAVVVLAAVLVVQLLPSSDSNTGSEADAALSQVASIAATRPPGITPGAGHYLYYQTTQLLQELGPPAPKGVRQFLFDVPETTQTWVASNGSGRQRIVVGQPRLAFPSDQAAWEAAGSPAGLHPVGADVLYPSTQAPNGGPLRAAHGQYFLSDLDSSQFPTQPAALEKYMDRYFKIHKESPSATFQLAGNVLGRWGRVRRCARRSSSSSSIFAVWFCSARPRMRWAGANGRRHRRIREPLHPDLQSEDICRARGEGRVGQVGHRGRSGHSEGNAGQFRDVRDDRGRVFYD